MTAFELKTPITCDCCGKKTSRDDRHELNIRGIVFLICLICKMTQSLEGAVAA